MRIATWSVVGLVVLGGPASVWAWGPVVHEVVTARAIDTLPKVLKTFYKNHRLEMPSLAPEAAEEPVEAEGPARRFAVDRLLAFPFTDLPRTESAFQQKFPEQASAAGRLPWLIHESHGKLVEAFKGGDKTRILAESDTLAGLVTDLHNPLALSDNADGQKTGQHGLWVRFSARLPTALDRDFDLKPDAAHLLDDPRAYVFSMMAATYVWLDNLLYQEDLARRGAPGYGDIYYEGLKERAGPILSARLSAATGDVGSYWYTAWTAAGRPELR